MLEKRVSIISIPGFGYGAATIRQKMFRYLFFDPFYRKTLREKFPDASDIDRWGDFADPIVGESLLERRASHHWLFFGWPGHEDVEAWRSRGYDVKIYEPGNAAMKGLIPNRFVRISWILQALIVDVCSGIWVLFSRVFSRQVGKA